MQKAKERLYWTADREEVVRQGDKRAALLYAAIGDEIPDSAAEKYGLVDGALPGFEEAAEAAAAIADKVPETLKPAKSTKGAKAAKEAKPSEDKEDKGGADKEQPAEGDNTAAADVETNGTAQ